MKTTKRMYTRALFVSIIVSGLLSGHLASATTTISPPAFWGTASVTVLVGKFSQWPNAWVIYRNNSTGACNGIAIPNSGSPNYFITDNIDVYVTGAADTARVNRSGSFTCRSGATYSVDTSGNNGGPLASLLNGFWLDIHGSAGGDDIENSLGYPSYSWGDAGDDQILGTEEETYILGGSGADKLKASNALLIGGSDRALFGGSEDDCLQDHTSSGGGGYIANIDCGLGSDEKTSNGTECATLPGGGYDPAATICQRITSCEVKNRAQACF